MDRLVVIGFLFLAGSCHASQRIVGGEPGEIENYNAVVQVDSLNKWTEVWSQNCAAIVVNNLNVLSAARCFHGINYEAANRRIRAGATYRNTGGSLIYITKEVNHPDFDPYSLENDISVVRLASPLVFSPSVQPGFVPPQGAVIPDQALVELAGWGLTAVDGAASSVLMHTHAFTINNAICRERYESLPIPRKVSANNICSGVLNVGGRGSCVGDFGGPVYFGQVVVGIISWSEGCAHAEFPGVNAAVAPHTSWIQSVAEATRL